MDTERVRAQLERILASAAFADAERARSFLRFVVNRALEGRTGEIKESVIAVEALGRNSSFDSKSDPIVRVEARRLRERLDSYYEREGRSDRVVISVPKGGYVPDFAERQPHPEAVTRTTRPALLLAGWVLFGLAALVLVWSYLLCVRLRTPLAWCGCPSFRPNTPTLSLSLSPRMVAKSPSPPP